MNQQLMREVQIKDQLLTKLLACFQRSVSPQCHSASLQATVGPLAHTDRSAPK